MKKRGFTLIELLVVIAIIALLLSILMPSLAKVKSLAKRVVCSAHLRQWGTAVHGYATDNKDYFPYNLYNQPSWWGGEPWFVSGTHDYRPFGCMTSSPVVAGMWMDYLFQGVDIIGLTASQNRKVTDQLESVLWCPTYKYGKPSFWNFVSGYFYLPYRLDNIVDPPTHTNYAVSGNIRDRGWVAKKKITSVYSPTAPIAMDIKMAFGGDPYITGDDSNWHSSSIPGDILGKYLSSHVSRGGEPDGGNFLFGDGRVEWYDNDDVSLGAVCGPIYNYYIISP